MHDQQVSGATVATQQRMRRHSGANAECPATRRYRCDGDADHKAATPPAGALRTVVSCAVNADLSAGKADPSELIVTDASRAHLYAKAVRPV